MRFWFLLIFILSSLIGNSQDKKEKAHAECQELNKEASNAFQIDFIESKSLAFEALNCAILNNDLITKPQAQLNISKSYTYLSRFDSSIFYAEAALTSFELLKDTLGQAKSIQTKATALLNMANYAEAVANYELAIKLYKKIENHDGEAGCTMNTGLVYSYLGDYDMASHYYFKALNIGEKARNPKNISYAQNNIGNVYFTQGKYKKAKEFYSTSLATGREMKDQILISDCEYYLGLIYLELNQLDSAEFFTRSAIAIDSNQNNLRGLSQKKIVLGDIFIKSKKLKAAAQLFEDSYEMMKSLPNNEQALAVSARKVGEIYRILKVFSKSEVYLLESIQLAKKGQVREPLYQSYFELSLLYENKGNFQDAYNYSRLYAAEKDSALNEENNKSINLLEAFYKDEKKRLEIENLEKESALNKVELSQEQADKREKEKQILLLIISLTGFAIIAAILIIFLRIRSRKNKALEVQKDQISKQNNEKEILLKEIHHRVKNNLQVIASLLSLQSNVIEDEKALDAVKEGQNRVKSIALIHQKLYQHEDISKVDFQEYIEQLISYLRSTFNRPNKEVAVSVTANNIQLDIDTAVPLGLIINEVITNSFKYAFNTVESPKIMIDLREDSVQQGKLVLEISDNGPGLGEQVDFEKSKTLGLKLVRMLSRQLDGSVNYSFNDGACFSIVISNTELRKLTD